MQAVIRSSLLCLVATLAILAGPLLAQTSSDRPPQPLALALEAASTSDWDRADRLAARAGAVAQDIVTWQRLRAGEGDWQMAQEFLSRRIDWPRLDQVAAGGEADLSTAQDADLLRYFETRPAQTAEGVLAHAAALGRAGDSATATAIVTDFWRRAPMEAAQQSAFLAAHGDALAAYHWARLDGLLWRGQFGNAERMLALVSPAQRALAEARIGLRRMVGNVDALIARVPEALRSDPGLTHARFEWRARKGRWIDARAMLAEHSVSAEALGRPAAWANRRRGLARDALRDGADAEAYRLASQHFLTSGSHYADLEWLSGYVALTRLDDPTRALTHFQNHDDAVLSPISQGRAGYWKGRAHRALGDTAAADMEFTRGAAYQTSFYGLLAAEAAGLPFDVGFDAVPSEDWRLSPLTLDSLFQAGQMLVDAGERNLAEIFWIHLAEQLGERDAALLGQAAIDMDEPHLAVMIGKAVARRGAIIPVPYYPLHPLAEAKLPVPAALALSIARRESEFDPVVVSGAGARGLMQVMPGTARDVAARLGVSNTHSTARLTSDPVYNARLGTVYLEELIDDFGANIVMVSAAYNAGPGRPTDWMRRFGDPRGDEIEAMVDWIEGIPFRETRNYVMRVSESMPIFRARLGLDPLPVPFSSELLGATLAR